MKSKKEMLDELKKLKSIDVVAELEKILVEELKKSQLRLIREKKLKRIFKR